MFAKRVFYTGRAAGVGFRFSTKCIANGYKVVGWVRNLADGRVELLAMSYEEEELAAFLRAIEDSELGGFIKETETEDCGPEDGVVGFGIR